MTFDLETEGVYCREDREGVSNESLNDTLWKLSFVDVCVGFRELFFARIGPPVYLAEFVVVVVF